MKKLLKSRSDRKVAGVLGGLAQSLGINSTLLRIIFIVLLITTGFFPMGLIYIAMALLLPKGY
ncbi:PspC domain-containing protein [Bacillus songklensis]|uniref:PspC domain-containing protein n=1 Tax=Bacillus songklensis TaxID=1069116 RepID=A0ABV8B2G1_9BACI